MAVQQHEEFDCGAAEYYGIFTSPGGNAFVRVACFRRAKNRWYFARALV
jgi:hypothetical protein